MTITLDDVELAIKILEEFMREYNKAVRVLRRFNRFIGTRGNGRLEEKLLEMMMSRNSSNGQIDNDVDVGSELTEDEKKRIEELKKKLLGLNK